MSILRQCSCMFPMYHCWQREDVVPRLLSRKTRCQHCLKPLLVLSDHCLRLTYHSICNDINHLFLSAESVGIKKGAQLLQKNEAESHL